MTASSMPTTASREYALEPTVAVVGRYPSPEGVAAGLARISRDATPIPELVRQAVEDTELARRRNENIIYEYGHSSIAEGAVFGVAVQDIPRSLSIDLVSHRLASYTQLSYRYVPVEKVPVQFFLPEEFRSGPRRSIFDGAVERTSALYAAMYARMTAHLLATGQSKTESGAGRRATEDARYVLPLAQTTQLGMTANARMWAHVITRLLSHALPEGRALGETLKAALQPTAPSLFPDKYIHALPFPAGALAALAARVTTLPSPAGTRVYPSRDGVTLLEYDPAAEEKLAATLLFRVSDLAGAQRAVALPGQVHPRPAVPGQRAGGPGGARRHAAIPHWHAGLPLPRRRDLAGVRPCRRGEAGRDLALPGFRPRGGPARGHGGGDDTRGAGRAPTRRIHRHRRTRRGPARV